MYYLSRHSVPTPAEAPVVATLDGKHEWNYHQQKHQDALKNIKGLVDQKAPRCIDPPVQRIQAKTRKSCEDQRRAEIGRANQRLVDRLTSIAKGTNSSDPRMILLPPMNASRDLLRTSASVASSAPSERSRSLNEPLRRKTQRTIDQDNAGLVNRILAVKSTFDVRAEARHFKKHQRTVQMLQRVQDGGQRQAPPRALPPLRPTRPSSNPGLPARGLEALLLPGDLRRCDSEPIHSTHRHEDSRPFHAATAPVGKLLRDDEEDAVSPTRAFTATRDLRGDLLDSSDGIERSNKDGQLSAVTSGLGQPLMPSWARDMQLPVGSAAWPHGDEETEHRRWQLHLEASQNKEKLGLTSDSPAPAGGQRGINMFTGMSANSDVKYADDWDEYSFASNSSAYRTRTSGW